MNRLDGQTRPQKYSTEQLIEWAKWEGVQRAPAKKRKRAAITYRRHGAGVYNWLSEIGHLGARSCSSESQKCSRLL